MKKNNKPALSRKESLNSVVVKNENIMEEAAGSGDITLTVRRDTSTLSARILMKLFGLPERKKIILDARGTFIWKCCDGTVTLKEMIERFSNTFNLNRKESEISIVYFIKSLAKRGLAGVVVKREKDGRTEEQ